MRSFEELGREVGIPSIVARIVLVSQLRVAAGVLCALVALGHIQGHVDSCVKDFFQCCIVGVVTTKDSIRCLDRSLELRYQRVVQL